MSFRVWPDGTVQDSCEEPYDWKSDDYQIVEAESEEAALETLQTNWTYEAFKNIARQ